MAKRGGSTGSHAYEISDINRPKPMHNPSPLSQAVAADNAFSDAGSSVAGSNHEFDQRDDDIITDLLDTKADNESHGKKSKKQINKSNAAKRALLPDETFGYIHTAKCRRLFSLAWYDDTTYASNAEALATPKALPVLCCNGPDCLSSMPEVLLREKFIDTSSSSLTEFQRE